MVLSDSIYEYDSIPHHSLWILRGLLASLLSLALCWMLMGCCLCTQPENADEYGRSVLVAVLRAISHFEGTVTEFKTVWIFMHWLAYKLLCNMYTLMNSSACSSMDVYINGVSASYTVHPGVCTRSSCSRANCSVCLRLGHFGLSVSELQIYCTIDKVPGSRSDSTRPLRCSSARKYCKNLGLFF